MKKTFTIIILTYFLFTLNINRALTQETKSQEENILKIGVLVPLKGAQKKIGKVVLNSAKLALQDIDDKNLKIYPVDIGDTLEKKNAALTYLKNTGVKIVIGPILYDNLENLEKYEEIIFLSLTNNSKKYSKNVINFGVNIESQMRKINSYLKKNEYKKTILLYPDNRFLDFIENSNEIKKHTYFKTINYETDPKKITSQIEKITNYKQRKINLKSRIKKIKNSEKIEDQNELKKLLLKDTLGKINFDSVVIIDFGDRLKSILNSFLFVDVTNENATFLSANQWFDENLFTERSSEKLLFPSIDMEKFNTFRKKYFNAYNSPANNLSVLAYDAIGIINYIWSKNKNFKIKDFNNIEFSGMQGNFIIDKNINYQNLKLYQIENKKFNKID